MERRWAHGMRHRCSGWRILRLAIAGALLTSAGAGAGITTADPLEQAWAAEGFDPESSAGLFVGINEFAEPGLSKIPFAVDDAVDLAHIFALELGLIPPQKVVLILAGEPQKPESQSRLRKLLQAGATGAEANLIEIYRHLLAQSKAAAADGLFVVAFSTHGFSDRGDDFLVAPDSVRRFIRQTGVELRAVLESVEGARARRRLVLLDACRTPWSDSRAVDDGDSAQSASFVSTIEQARGQVVLAAASPEGYTYEDFEHRNGVFTAAVLNGLQGHAVADGRGFITLEHLADYVDARVRSWAQENHPGHAVGTYGGITRILTGEATYLPLAVSPTGWLPVHAYRQRRDAALARLRQNLSDGPEGPIRGVMYDEVWQALPEEPPSEEFEKASVESLLDALETLDGTVSSQRRFALFFSTFPDRPAPVDTVPASEKRWALIIGNANYANVPLRTPLNDARAMATLLAKADFDVQLLENADHRSMEAAVRRFGAQLRGDTVGLFYFSGQGVQIGGENYLIPIDAEIIRESDLLYKATSLGSVLDQMAEAGNRLNLVIIDACRDNPFERSAQQRGLAAYSPPRGVIMAFAAAPGSVAFDGDSGQHGVFTEHLLVELGTPGLKFMEVFRRTAQSVQNATSGQQRPWLSSALVEDFILLPTSATAGGRTGGVADVGRGKR